MNAIGIDVSKGKSMIAVLRPFGEVVRRPVEVHHNLCDMNELIKYIKSLDGETRIVMEHTGRYYEPVVKRLSDAGLFVSAVNPKLINDFDNNSLRKVKSDKADAIKIARYTLDKWNDLRQYSSMDKIRNQLKTMNRQFDFYTKQKAALKNNLIALLDQTYPGSNNYFDSPARRDGHRKWVDFVDTYRHVDCVRKLSLDAFTEHYQKWCKRKGYNFQPCKAEEIYTAAQNIIAVFPKDAVTKMLIKQAIEQVISISSAVEHLRAEMDKLASQLPEYQVVLDMKGVGSSLGPQLMAELGDIRRFAHRGAITAFTGVDPGINESGNYKQKKERSNYQTRSGTAAKNSFSSYGLSYKNSPGRCPCLCLYGQKTFRR